MLIEILDTDKKDYVVVKDGVEFGRGTDVEEIASAVLFLLAQNERKKMIKQTLTDEENQLVLEIAKQSIEDKIAYSNDQNFRDKMRALLKKISEQ